jgi:hypothetical protein
MLTVDKFSKLQQLCCWVGIGITRIARKKVEKSKVQFQVLNLAWGWCPVLLSIILMILAH